MSSTNCPHCGGEAMTLGEKIMRGSAKAYDCKACKEPVGLSNWDRLLSLTTFAMIIVFAWLLDEYAGVRDDTSSILLSFLLAMGLGLILKILIIPIVVKDRK